jgi:cephalosporin-C deacetylase-like acetyl esterase
MNEWVKSKEERTWERTLKTLSYFDSMNLATRINCPVFMGVGLQDPVCPPSTNFAALNHTKGNKKYQVYARAGHSLGPLHQKRVLDWIRKNFNL